MSKFTQQKRKIASFSQVVFMCLMSTMTSKTTACLLSVSLFTPPQPPIFGVRILLIPSSSSCFPLLYHCHNIYPYSQLNLPFYFSFFWLSIVETKSSLQIHTTICEFIAVQPLSNNDLSPEKCPLFFLNISKCHRQWNSRPGHPLSLPQQFLPEIYTFPSSSQYW